MDVKKVARFYLLMIGMISFSFQWASAQSVRGTVVGDSGTPLIGASVFEKGTNNGTVTDLDGGFDLTMEGEDPTLVISYTGHQTQELKVSGRNILEVILEEGATLNEVVVTALGIGREERALGYAVERIGGGEIAASATHNVLNSLTGKVAGVQISEGNGVAGGSVRVTIRGNNSLVQGKNQPLIIVDGVPIENSISGAGSGSLLSTDNGKDWGSGINNLNTWDIGDITVLKGPNAAALYGSRGANGVVLITTKKGSKGDGLGIDFNMSQMVNDPYRFRDVQNVFGEGSASVAPPQFEQDDQGNNLLPAIGFWGSGASWGPEMDGTPVRWWNGETLPFSPQPDNISSFFSEGLQSSYNLAFSGGSDLGNFRVSLTQLETTPVVPNTDRSQSTINVNTNVNVTSKVRATASISYINASTLNSPHLGNSESSIGKNLTYNWGRSYRPELERGIYKQSDGTRAPAGIGYPKNDALGRGRGRTGSFWWNLFENNETRNRDRLMGSLGLSIDLTSFLVLEGRLGIDNYNDDNISKRTPTDIDRVLGGRYSHTLARNRIQNHTAFLRLKEQSLGQSLKVNAYAGGEFYKRSYYSLFGKNGNRNFVFPNLFTTRNVDFPTTINSKYATDHLLPSEGFYDKEIQSVFAAVDFSFKNYLFLQITGRNDWTSTLPAGSNSYFYPSVSVGLDVTEALGLTNDVLSFAKLRLAYAQVGNDTDPYQTGARLNSGNFAGAPYASVNGTIPPLSLKPERQNSFEGGLDLRLFNDRLSLDFTYYNIYSYDQILEAPVPITSGYSKLRFNTGEVRNKGIEVLLGFSPLRSEKVSWDVGINFSRNSNVVESLTEGAEQLILGKNLFGNFGPSIVARPGEEFGTIIGWDYTYFDGNGNGVTDDSERVPDNRIIDENGQWYEVTDSREPLGNASPDWLAGLRNTVSYKGVTLTALVDFKMGGDVFWGTHATAVGFGQSPQSLEGRNAEFGGQPWVFTDDAGVETTYNNGLLKPGVYADGTPNDKVQSYVYSHLDVFSWGPGITTPFVSDNSYVKMRELSLSYDFPAPLIEKIGFLQNARISLVGRNLFYLYDNAPDNINPEGLNGSGFNQGIEWGALPGSRQYGVVLNTGF